MAGLFVYKQFSCRPAQLCQITGKNSKILLLIQFGETIIRQILHVDKNKPEDPIKSFTE